jgi:uncharacterized membrane protein YcaP (DUF421 family)
VQVAVHTVVIYFFLMVTLRVMSRRQLGQLNVIDVVIVVTLGSAVETAMVNGNTTLPAGLVSAGTLFALNLVFGRLMLRSKRLRHLAEAGPVLLVHDGQFVEEHLKRIGMTHNDVMEGLREQGYQDLKHIRFAVLEVDGDINVVPADGKSYTTQSSEGIPSS